MNIVATLRPAAYRHHGGIEEIENSGDQTDRSIRKVECLPDGRKDSVEDLAVALIEQVSHP